MKYTLTVCLGAPYTHQDSFYKSLLSNYCCIQGPVLLTVKALHQIKL